VFGLPEWFARAIPTNSAFCVSHSLKQPNQLTCHLAIMELQIGSRSATPATTRFLVIYFLICSLPCTGIAAQLFGGYIPMQDRAFLKGQTHLLQRIALL